MDGENNGSKPYFQIDDLGGSPEFLETPICVPYISLSVHTCIYEPSDKGNAE